MRTTAKMLLVGLLACFAGGCSSGRWNLAKSEAPRSKPSNSDDVRIKYGNPWAKSDDAVTEKGSPDSGKLSSELEARLAESRSRRSRDGNPADTLQLAATAEQTGDFASAKRYYQQILDRDPRHGEAHHRLAVIADQQQDHRTADLHYQQALAANRRDADLLSDIGYSHLLRGNLLESERYLKEALEVNQYHRMAMAHLGQVYAKQGKYDAALAMFRQVATEKEAQKMIAKAFPNGRPGGDNTLLANERHNAAPSRTPAESPGGQLPSWAVAPPQPANTQTSAVPRQATLAQMADTLYPSTAPAIAPNNLATPAANGQIVTMLPSAAPGNPALTPPATFHNPPVQNSTVPEHPTPPAYWDGRAQPGAAAPPASPAGFNAPPAVTSVPQYSAGGSPWNLPPVNASPSSAWNTNDVQPANFDSRSVTGANPWPAPPAQPATTQINNPDVTRWAAHLAMNSGPGAMFPAVTPGPAASPVAQANALDNGQNAVRWAYTEQQPGQPQNQVQHAIAWDDPAAGNDVQPAAWRSDLAPVSPWNDWQSPAPQSRNWTTPQEFGPPAVHPQPPSTSPQPLPSTNAPPPWPTNTAPPATTAAPAATTIPNWPYAPAR